MDAFAYRQRDREMTRPAWVVALFLCALPLPAPAGEPPDDLISVSQPPGANGEDQGGIFVLFVNERPRGDVIARLRGADVLVPVAELEAAGVRGLSGRQESIDGTLYVSLVSLAPHVGFKLDEAEVAIKLQVTPDRLGSTRIDLAFGAPPGMVVSRDSSAFLNYSLTTADFQGVSGFAEGGWNVRGNLLYGSISRRDDGAFVRGLTTFTVDEPSRLRRWTLGDRFAETGLLGGGAFVGGVGVSRSFDLDPYFFRFPRFGLSGAVSTPSTVDVYVNGTLVRRQELPPGEFDLDNVPVSAGSGSTRLIVRDAFGTEREIASPYYFSTGVLAKGVSDFSYNVGFVRENLAAESFDYDRVAFLGRHRAGITDGLTLGARLEASRGLVSGGPTLTARLAFGEIDLAAAASRDGDVSGRAGSLGFAHLGRVFSFGGSLRAVSRHYAHTSLSAANDRSRLEVHGHLGASLSRRVSLSAQYRSSDRRDDGRRREASLSASAQLGRGANGYVSASRLRAESGKWTTGFSVGLSYSYHPMLSASVGYSRNGDQGVAIAEVQRPLTRGTGGAYIVQLRDGSGERSGLARLQYQGAFGRYEFSYDRLAGSDRTTLTATGGLVAIGGSLYATRPVQQSFALIRIPGVAGIRGFSSNQGTGRTNRSGDILVPDLLSYYGNRLSIADEDVPIEYAIDATERIVAPPNRGGAVVTFPVRKIRSVTGVLVVTKAAERIVPASGELVVEVDGGEIGSPIGTGGEFYFESLPPGRHPAMVKYSGGTCSFGIDVPASSEIFLDLGRLACDAL